MSQGASSQERKALTVDWPRFVELVDSKQRIMLTSHIRPDCDALGSELAMAAILEELGKEVQIVNAFDVPPNLKFLDPEGKAKRLGVDVSQEWIDSVDLLLILDTTAWAQLGDMGDVIRSLAGDIAVMDHHVSGDDLGAELFKDTTSEATGRLVFEAARHLGVDMSPAIARPAFAALATDTGWFRFASTTSQTYRIAAEMVEAGVRPDEVYRDLYENETMGRLRMVGRVMARAEGELDGRLIHTHIELEDFDATGAVPSDSEDVVNMLLTVGGTQVAVILVEQRTGGFKISFRSRCHVDCSQLAEQFGGGGHKKAAGAFLGKSLGEAKEEVLQAAREAILA